MKQENKGSDKKSVEVFVLEKKTDAVLAAGLMEFKGWRRGKTVSEKEYMDALREFMNASAGG